MSQALYRKYRSRSLDEIVGQDHITSLLSAAITADSVSHAYLLTGPRGVGKTSIARIIAHEINGLEYSDESQHLDIIEIDAASNNGVEDVRDLRDKVHIAPSSARKKIYIIDEVHMLSKPAFNALLKTLEEPPHHVVFILATTDVDKLPATIISRVQRFNFRSISHELATEHLRRIADQEDIAIDDAALELIAQHGQGSFRDSIGLLDQVRHSAGSETIGADDVRAALGATSQDTIDSLIAHYRQGDLHGLTQTLNELESTGTHAGVVTQQLVGALHQTIAKHPEDLSVLDELLSAGSSHYPYIRLLTVLAHNVDRPTRPTVEPIALPPPQPTAPADPIETRPQEKPKKAATTSPKPTKAAKKSQPATEKTDFDWDALIAAANGDAAFRSLLAKAGHTLKNDTLTIYAGNKLNAKLLNGPKQLPKLHAALEKIGAGDITVDILADKVPLADSQLADVADMMGGGEEVAYDG